MNGSRKLLLAVIVVGVATGSAVLAAEGDATVTPKESEGNKRLAHFKANDTDENGTLSLAEFTAMQEKQMAARKAKMGDKFNADGAAKRPSVEERFKMADKDGNGELTPEELQSARQEGMRKHKAMKEQGANKAAAPVAAP